ncbi:ubiquitin-associated protein 2-like isoform X3 [Strigops habroptila]|uniref:ubiquitin-associated protein 2-like isoform X3 n=1 Tax=Strigops habroptila TaxID=2489341 RepID=UPI0011CF9641|nr:ubiquitin-associated protein 2-like isoform X3 [Strigops habroptila]
MMTSVGTNRARGNWEQTQTQSQTQHKQRPQATAEQIRLAQMISDHNDADFEEKVKQLIDITGKNQDECVIALHDCNGDVNRAINVLLEGNPDTHSWEMVGKKKGVSGQKESGQTEPSEESKENRERERDFSRRRGGPPRRGRGASRGREFRGQENGLDGGKSGGSSGRGTERGRRGRGRGRGGSGRRGGRFSAQGMGTFNPADYAEPAGTDESYSNSNTWNNTGSFEPDDGTRLDFIGGEGSNYPRKFDTAPGTIPPGAWRAATEEWGTEDWNEDLSETKIFTASNVSSVPLPAENVTITAGQRIDLAVLLGKTPSSMENESPNLESSQAPSLAQPLVFSNSKQSAISQPASGNSFSHHSMVSMLGKGFGDVGEAKGSSTTGSQFLEQFKTAQALAQLAAQHTQPGGSTTASSWDMGSTTQTSSLVQYDLKNPTDSSVHSPFTKRQAFTSTSTMIEVFMQEKQPVVTASTTVPAPSSSPLPSKANPVPQMSPGSSDNQSSSPQPAQQKLKQQKKKASLTSKIPALAVEMPGSADISGLNLQFGALQFGSEPVLAEYESTPTTSAAVSQAQSSLYTSTASSESSSTVSSNQSQESGYQSSTIQTATFTSQNSAQGPLYEQRSTQTRRYPNSISSSPQKDLPQAKNGFSSVQPTPLQTTQAVEGATGPAVKSDSPSAPSITPLNDGVSASSLLTTASQHSTALSSLSHSEELPSTTSAQLSSTLPTQQNSLSSSTSSGRTSTSTLLHTSVESEASLHSSASTFSTSSSTVSAAPPVVSVSSSLSSVSSLGLSLSSNSTVTASTRSSVATTSGKAPPNLPPGVPPLLPNPYIMAPGLLHAYPVYGYDDLQMLQTRFPLDYYSIPFPTPTTPLTGRDGSLSSNPYSGDLTKFGRGDASSPAPATTLAQPQQSQTQTHHTTQQTFLNPALPPGYSYTSLPYYTGVPGLPSTFQYGPAVFPVAPTSSKQHGVNVSVNASATPFQQPSGYGSHGYSTGVSVTSSNTGVPDISGSVYSKTQQSFEKQGFHTGTPAASFNLPSALGSGGPINPATAAAYPPTPFMHILTPHQQPHSQILHHHLQQDGQVLQQLPYLQMILCCQRQQEDQSGSGQRSQGSSIPQKSQANKSAYNSYSWGAN